MSKYVVTVTRGSIAGEVRGGPHVEIEVDPGLTTDLEKAMAWNALDTHCHHLALEVAATHPDLADLPGDFGIVGSAVKVEGA